MDDALLQGNDQAKGRENSGKHLDARVCAVVLDGAYGSQANSRHFRQVRLRNAQGLSSFFDLLADDHKIRNILLAFE